MKKIINCLLFLSSMVFHNATAQGLSPLKIYDLSPGMEAIDSTTSKEGKSKLYVNFKLDDPSIADSVFFWFGTAKNMKDVVMETGKFEKKGSVYSVKTQGPSYPVINSEVSCRIKITKKQFKDSSYLSMIVKDKNGLFTDVLTIRIN